jgi:hypothetical protein
MLHLDIEGRFIEPITGHEGARLISSDELPIFLKRKIVLPKAVTDVFIWVHGWQTDETQAVSNARRLFAHLEAWFLQQGHRYSKLGVIVPAFVAVHWPSTSTHGLIGYRRIRDRAKKMTTSGEAAFFLASLLGYLDAENERSTKHKVLAARGGFYLHCIGHSFGGRFLASAIQAAAKPTGSARKLLAAAHRDTGFPFNVDSLLVLQMAAGARTFSTEFSYLLGRGPLCGPIVLTYSTGDRALCRWHRLSEWEAGIGCGGAIEPKERIGSIPLRPVDTTYTPSDFSKDITNVDASHVFSKGPWVEGSHSDFWHDETFHLIASVVEQVRL